MKLLVTGGAGFIGSNFIRYILERNTDLSVVNLDLLTYAGRDSTVADLGGNPRHRFVHGDVTDRGKVDEILSQGIDTIVHFAAESHVDRSIARPDPFVSTNLLGTHCLIEAAKRRGIRRFIQISSDEVYGSIPAGRQAGPSDPLSPSNSYAATKAGADMLVTAAHKTHGFPAIITRCTNNYGPWQHPEKFIPILTIRALQGRELPVYGDGLQERDWIHVEDHCRALEAILMAGIPGRIYTIAGGRRLQNLDLARRVLKLAGVGGARIRHVEDRLGHDRRYDLDDAVTRAELGWTPAIDLDTGLARTVAWYKSHREWWEPITESKSLQYQTQVGSP